MVRPKLWQGALALIVLGLAAGTAAADPITFTGNVANDFNPASQGVHVVPVSDNPNDVAPASWKDAGLAAPLRGA